MDFFSAFGHDDARSHYQTVYHTAHHHQASLTHEAIAGAAGFAAMHAYEAHLRATGHEPSHSLMKELLAGIAAAEVDKLVETKGLDWVDRHRAKKLAAAQAHALAHERYAGGAGWEYARAQRGHAVAYEYGAGLPWGAPGHVGYGGYEAPPQGYYPPPQEYYPQGYSGPPQQGYYPEQQGQQEYRVVYEEYEVRPEHHHHHHHHHH